MSGLALQAIGALMIRYRAHPSVRDERACLAQNVIQNHDSLVRAAQVRASSVNFSLFLLGGLIMSSFATILEFGMSCSGKIILFS